MTKMGGQDDCVVVTGAGGFIGGWLVRHLLEAGFRKIRAVDLKPFEQWFQLFPEAENVMSDLRDRAACATACRGAAAVYNLAADMGGMGFIETHKAECMLSVLINTHMLMAARDAGVRTIFLSPRRPASMPPTSSVDRRRAAEGGGRLSGDAGRRLRLGEAVLRADVPALLARISASTTRVVRYHNVYGPHGT